MKRSFFAALFIFIMTVFSASGQTVRKDYDFSGFGVISASGEFQVILEKGSSYSVQVVATESYVPYLNVRQEGSGITFSVDEKSLPGELKKTLFSKNKSEFRAIVTVPDRSLNAVNLSDKSTLSSSSNFNSDAFVISLTDNSEIKKLSISAQRVEIKMEKKSTANLEVTCDDLVIGQSLTSDLTLTQKSSTVSVEMATAAILNMGGRSETLKITAKGSSRINLLGEGKDVFYQCSGATNLDSTEMSCENLEVDLNGFCNIKSKVSKSLSIKMAGGSNLSFSGDPAISIKSVKNSSISKL